MSRLTPEQAELHRQRILRLDERIKYLKNIGYVYMLAMLLSLQVAIGFASIDIPHIPRVFLVSVFMVFTIINAIGLYRTRKHRSSLEQIYYDAMFKPE